MHRCTHVLLHFFPYLRILQTRSSYRCPGFRPNYRVFLALRFPFPTTVVNVAPINLTFRSWTQPPCHVMLPQPLIQYQKKPTLSNQGTSKREAQRNKNLIRDYIRYHFCRAQIGKAKNTLFTETLIFKGKGMLNRKFRIVVTSRGRQKDRIIGECITSKQFQFQ